MATRKTAPTNWTIESTGDSPMGQLCKWINSEDGTEVTLPKGLIPDEKTLALLAMNSGNEYIGVEFPPREPGNPPITFDDSAEVPESAIDRIMVSLQSRSTDADARAEIKVYKVPPDGAERYCATFTLDEFESRNLELIRSKFGGGKFRICVMGTTPKTDAQGQPIKFGGRFVRLSNQYVEIENPLEPLRPSESGSSSNPIVEQLMRQNADMMQRFETLLTKPQPTFEDELRKMKLLKDVLGGNDSKPEKSAIELISEARDLLAVAKEMQPEGGGSNDSLIGIGKDLLGMIGPVLQQRNQQHQNTGAVPVVALPAAYAESAPAGTAQNPANETTGQTEMGMQQVFFNALIKSMCAAAARGEDSKLFAVNLTSQLPDEIIDALDLPTWFDVLSEMYPVILPHRDWFTKLRAEIIEILDAEDDKPG